MVKDARRRAHNYLDETYWDGLDNAAKLFPAISNTRSSNVFRMTAVLFEEVRPDILKQAVERALEVMPAFAVKLHTGLFWYYFEPNYEKPTVREDYRYPCTHFLRYYENGYLFRVTYYHRRINLEVFHALTDGMGATSFLHCLLYYYFNLMDGDAVPEDVIRRIADTSSVEFDEDSFVRNTVRDDEQSRQSISAQVSEPPEAYHINGYKYDGDRLGALMAILPTDKLLALAHEKGVTLSEYMCGLLIWSIYNTTYRRSKRSKPIVISVPVNLRGLFGSNTMRNFFGHLSIAVSGEGLTFDDVLKTTAEQLKNCLTKGYFERQIAAHVRIEQIPIVRFVPIWLKNLILRQQYMRTQRTYTCTFSNVGRMQLPEAIADRVERFELLLSGSQTHPKKVSLISYRNNLVLGFASTIDDNSIERFMISFLVSEGLDVTISSNETPAPSRSSKEEPSRLSKEKAKAEKAERKAIKKAAKREKKERERQ
ncbi:MAG: hypothetical protein IJ493_04990 [Clostridia bacterium]|nr:hypothetical protein [Clostridia bacterium]